MLTVVPCAVNARTLQPPEIYKILTVASHNGGDKCTALQNVDDLGSLPNLERIDLGNCTMLQNVNNLKNLSNLSYLNFSRSTELLHVDELKRLTNLKYLDLYECYKIPISTLRELSAALPETNITYPDRTNNPPQ